jgi:CBS domain-containing protein
VVFVAEATGGPGFIVPGLLAAAASQLVMGDASVSTYQEAGRVGHLERRFRLPVTAAVRTDVPTVAPDLTVDDLVWEHLLAHRQTSAAVVDGTTYCGVVHLGDLGATPRDRWSDTPVAAVARRDAPTVVADCRLEDAVDLMQNAGVDTLPVLTADGAFLGIVTLSDVVRLDEILRHADGDAATVGS